MEFPGYHSSKQIAITGGYLIFMAFLTLGTAVLAQTPKEKIYAVFLLNFSRFIEWPQASDSDEFTIGIFDDPPLAAELKNVLKIKSVGKQKIKIIEYTLLKQVGYCNILFIPEHKTQFAQTLIGKFPYTATLFVTEKEGMAKQGININFLIIDGKLKFELNQRAMKGRGLKASPEFQSFSIPIE
jgi:hypothetical protein